ncbi:MAG TPA: hypothetical protein VFG64_04475 [Dongiaceae bacterium]|nr:hypothetical protein [Dongiaceae bacterium]
MDGRTRSDHDELGESGIAIAAALLLRVARSPIVMVVLGTTIHEFA